MREGAPGKILPRAANWPGPTLALVTLLSPEMGMVQWYILCDHHANVSLLIQPLVGPCLSTGWGAHVVVTMDASSTG